MFNVFVFLLFSVGFAQEKTQVSTFTPQGYVKSVEQIRIEFAKPMVKFGELNLEAPAQSSCLDFKKGQGRWIDTRNWVFDYKEPLAGGLSCEVTVHGQKYRFNTGGPHVKQIFPQIYRPVDPEQNFVIVLDSPVKKETLKTEAYFVAEGLGDRLPVVEVTGGEADKVLKAAQQEYQYEKEEFKGDIVVLKAQRPFPAGGRVSFVWSKWIQSPSGNTSQEDETFEFQVREPFKAEFGCEREGAGKPCVPLLGMRLSFNSSISLQDARQIYIETADKKILKPWGLEDQSAKERISYLEFKGPFAQKSLFTLVIPKGLKDEEGRLLSNQSQFPLKIKTGDDPALLKFPASFGVIESGSDAAMAVTLRRVEKTVDTQFAGWTGQFKAVDFKSIIAMLSEVQQRPYGEEPLKWRNKPTQKIQIKKPSNPAETEVVGVPLKGNGFFVVEMKSPLLGESLLDKKKPFYVRSSGLVTNLSVHVKYTQQEAWVWVTELKSAKTVSGAKVQIFDNAGNVMATATTDAKGWTSFKFAKSISDWKRDENSNFYGGFFAVAEKGDDFSFTHTSWDKGIESWRFQIRGGDSESSFLGHAILDRTLLKPEDKLSAKIVLRKTTAGGLGLPAESELPTRISLVHDSGLQSFKLPLKWNRNSGVALFSWTIPAGAKLGNWSLTLERDKPAMQIVVGDVAVESFRVPLIQVRVDGRQPSYVLQKDVPVQVSGTYFSGGPTGDLQAKMRWSVEPGYFSPQDDDFNDYSFANGAVKEGLFRQGESDSNRYIPQSGVKDLRLNKQGVAEETVSGIRYADGPQNLRAEVEFKDPNGEIQSVSRTFPLWPSSVVLGIKSHGWSATQEAVEFDVVALDLHQKALKGQSIQVDLFTSRYYSHRKRLVGGFYAYEDFQEYKKVGELCKGTTDAKGQFLCRGKSKVAGNVIAVVSSKDSQGRISYANVSQWILKPGETQWFGADDNDRADLIPFKKTYEPGEVAEFQLRTPFPQSKVLVTVEREGVLHSEVLDVSGEKPTIKIPIKKEYVPNVVVSAFAIRGRLADPKPTALVDLAKPAYKLGLAQIKVGWKENTLKVAVTTDKKTYKARQKSQVTVSVKDHLGRPASSAEVALVAVDEGLLALRDNNSWDLLSSMMRLRPHSVQTATSQTQVVGKRHFGLKALPIGGDGGGGLRRELFDTLLYWNPSVKLNAKGEAKIDITLNDSTTSFRIVAVALQGKDQFGTGWTSIQSSQDLMILPGLSAVAREGDAFQAGFTVRNASSSVQNLNLALAVTPPQEGHNVQQLRLNPGEANEVFWNIKASGAGTMTYVITAKDSQGRVMDEIKKTQTILPLRVARIYQSEWGSWPDFKKLSLQQPQGADPAKSSIQVEVANSLGASSAGIEDFWKNYVFTCLEQQVSRTVSLNDKKAWQKLEEKLDAYIDGNGLLRYFPGNSPGSVNLTAYILSVAHEAGFTFSDDHEARLLDAMNAFAEGRLNDGAEFNRADTVLKKISVFETLSRYRRLNVDLLSGVDYQPNQWPLYSLVEWYQIHLWEKDLPGREQKLAEIEPVLRNRFYFSAKRLQLREESLESMPWLMRDPESSILRLILTTVTLPQWKQDAPRLFQGVLARQVQGAWSLTAGNAWGSLTARKLQEVYSEKVEGTFAATLNKNSQTWNWVKGGTGVLTLPWTTDKGELALEQKGAGNPWITVSAKAAIPVTKPVLAGFNVEKTITAVEQKKKGVWSVGDTAKVQLKIKAKAAQTWVVVEDPIPAGASILQASYATSVERKPELIRFYHSWFPQEEQIIEYTLRFNQVGTYQLPVTRIEAMYSPDLFAELPESVWKVQE
nr:MG2 domain-containing protein [Bdellovibrio sp. HM001]